MGNQKKPAAKKAKGKTQAGGTAATKKRGGSAQARTPKTPKKPGLTTKQKLFVKEYLVDLNATGAARRAGYSKASANVDGPRLLRHPGVAEAIHQAMKDRGERLRAEADDVFRRLAGVGFATMEDFVDIEDGRVVLKSLDTIPGEALPALGEVTVTPTPLGDKIKIKLRSNLEAMKEMGRHLGIGQDTNNERHRKKLLGDKLAAAQERARKLRLIEGGRGKPNKRTG